MIKKQNMTKKELLEILEIIKKHSKIERVSVKKKIDNETLTIHTGCLSVRGINAVEHRGDFLKIIEFFKEEE